MSWVVAVLFAPLIGVKILPKTMKGHHDKPSRLLRAFRAMLLPAMRFRWLTVAFCVGLLGLSIVGMGHVQQQFFPSSDRNEVLVDLTLPQNASIGETRAQMDRFEAALKGDPEIRRWSSYVGQGAIRFYLPLDQQLANAFFGQIVIETVSLEARDRTMARLQDLARATFVAPTCSSTPSTSGLRSGDRSSTGSAVPISRWCGPSAEARQRGGRQPERRRADLRLERARKVLRVEILQDKARPLSA